RQVQRRAGFHRHVDVRDRTLQGERRRQQVDVRGGAPGLLLRHEAQVVVTVCDLRLTVRVDHVDLRRDLVTGSQPGRGDQRQDVVVVVGGEVLRVADRELVQRAPDAV